MPQRSSTQAAAQDGLTKLFHLERWLMVKQSLEAVADSGKRQSPPPSVTAIKRLGLVD